ncbi:MAG: hypothetical protein IH612_17590 [Desulfofustis sp.]|nr:hypothetical protein [Desulfofustis sp.]
MENDQEHLEVVLVSQTYGADLKGRQSVRTTFKLSPRCIDALSLLAGQLGIKQKSIVDHLVDDTEALHALARDADRRESAADKRVAKTYVISRRTLESLDRVSKRFQTPRDALVESSIERIMPLLSEEKRKHEQRKQLKDRLQRLLQASKALLEQADAVLDEDDPVVDHVVLMARTVQAGCSEVAQIIDKGRRLEDF